MTLAMRIFKKKPKEYIEVPILGLIILISNAYAWQGNLAHLEKFATKRQWWRRILKPVFYCAIAAVIATSLALISCNVSEFADVVTNFCQRSLVTLLGFGLATFSLILALPDKFLEKFSDRKSDSGLGPEIIAADLAFPLVVVGVSVLVSLIMAAIPMSDWIASFLFSFLAFFSLQQIFELIGFLFLSLAQVLMANGGIKKS